MALYRERGLKELSTEVTHEGIGIGGGFIVGGVVGRQIENMLMKTPVSADSTISNKIMAWVANNGAKAAVYILAKHYDAGSPLTKEATKALAGSIVYDTVLRLANHGYNPADVSLAGYRILGDQGANPANVQKLIQENSLLRTELNKALQKLAAPNTYPPSGTIPGSGTRPPGVSPNVGLVPPPPDSPVDFRYGATPAFQSPAVEARQRQYGAMPFSNPTVNERQRRYGAMPFEQAPDKTHRERGFGFMSMPTDKGPSSYGML